MKKIIFILLILFSSKLFCNNFESMIILLETKGIIVEEFDCMYDYDNDIIYINLKNYLNLIGAESLEIRNNHIQGIIEKNNYNIPIPQEFINIIGEDIYLTPSDMLILFQDDSGKWNSDTFSFKINPKNIETRIDYERVIKEQKSLISDNKGDEIKYINYSIGKSKWISPGIIGFTYNYNDITKSYNRDNTNLKLSYGTQFLKGDFYIDYDIIPESKLDYIQLRYPSLYKEYNLYIGDTGSQAPDGIPSSKIRGLTIAKGENFGTTKLDTLTIEGPTYGSTYIELYGNGNLIDFKNLSLGQNRYSFEEPKFYSRMNLSVKYYFQDGTSRIENINILNNNTLLAKGESDFIFQFGEVNNWNNNFFQIRNSFGFLDYLTLGAGIYSTDINSKKYDFLSFNPILLTRFGQIGLDYYYDFDNNSSSIKSEYRTNFGIFDYYFTYEKWSEALSYSQSISDKYETGISLNVGRNNFNINYQNYSYIDSDCYNKYSFFSNSISNEYLYLEPGRYNEIEFNYTTSFLYNIFFSFSNNYIWQDKQKTNSSQFKISYGGFNFFNLELGLNHILSKNNEDKSQSTSYNLNLTKNTKNFNSQLFVSHNENFGTIYGVNFTVYLDNLISGELNFVHDDNEISADLSIRKEFNLSSPLKNVRYDSSKDGFVTGIIFLDSNANGKFDCDDIPLNEVTILINGKKGISNKNGSYSVDGIPADEFLDVEVDSETLEAGLIPYYGNNKVKVRRSSNTELNIAIVEAGFIEGGVTEKFEDHEKLLLINSKNQIIATESISKQGGFVFSDIPPGKYHFKTLFSKKDFKNSIEVLAGEWSDNFILE